MWQLFLSTFQCDYEKSGRDIHETNQSIDLQLLQCKTTITSLFNCFTNNLPRADQIWQNNHDDSGHRLWWEYEEMVFRHA